MKSLSIVLPTLVLVHVAARAAHAYVDPGVGSMALQLILAGAAGAAVIVRLLWRRLLGLLGVGDSKKTPTG